MKYYAYGPVSQKTSIIATILEHSNEYSILNETTEGLEISLFIYQRSEADLLRVKLEAYSAILTEKRVMGFGMPSAPIETSGGFIEGDYTTWTLLYVNELPVVPHEGWSFSWFLDCINEILYVLFDEAVTRNERLWIVRLEDFETLYLTEERDNIAACGWYVEWIIPGVFGMASGYQSFFSRSLLTYFMVLDGDTWETSFFIFREGMIKDEITFKADVAAVAEIGGNWGLEGFEISPDGKWVVITTYDPIRILVYKGGT